eukprot:676917-Rhodomonas_salina.3
MSVTITVTVAVTVTVTVIVIVTVTVSGTWGQVYMDNSPIGGGDVRPPYCPTLFLCDAYALPPPDTGVGYADTCMGYAATDVGYAATRTRSCKALWGREGEKEGGGEGKRGGGAEGRI